MGPLIGALPESPYTYQFIIVNENSLNAFALPGGFITIHSGLILKADSAETAWACLPDGSVMWKSAMDYAVF